MIPEEKKDAVSRALQNAFGVSEYDDIRQLTAGLSTALIFRMVVLGRPYLLRIITRTDAISDPTHQINCLKAPTEAGLAPKLLYTSVEDRILITDFIEAKPFPLAEARLKMPDLLKRLHALPRFPNRINYLETMDGIVRKFQEAKILPESMTGEIFNRYRKILDVYPNNPENWVSCHNDCKPENILYDGERPWLVDWEAAFPNDRYTDLAVVGNFLVTNEDEEKEYLRIYFGEEPGEYYHARFFLMTQLMHVFYFIFFMKIVFATGKAIDPDSPKPDFREFHNDIWAGKISLKGDDTRLEYAWTHFQQLQNNLRLKRFGESLRVASYGH
ncbi:MAG TPA: phosphotransferase [Puia sp.]